MPELPEAETIGKALNFAMSGKKIEKVEGNNEGNLSDYTFIANIVNKYKSGKLK